MYFYPFRCAIDQSEEVIEYVDIETIKNGSSSATTTSTLDGVDWKTQGPIIMQPRLSTKSSATKKYEIKHNWII